MARLVGIVTAPIRRRSPVQGERVRLIVGVSHARPSLLVLGQSVGIIGPHGQLARHIAERLLSVNDEARAVSTKDARPV